MSQVTIQTDYSLKSHNTFGVDAQAKYFACVRSLADLQQLATTSPWQNVKKFVLGQGSNTLFVQDFDGLVINNAIEGLHAQPLPDDQVLLEVGAGMDWHSLVQFCVDHQYYGIENLSLIPGTVGAAPIQNIGAYGVELKDVFHSLDAFAIKTGELTTFDRADCQFGYRDSVFKNTFKNQFIITTVRLLLSSKPHFKTDYYALTEKLKDIPTNKLTLKLVSDAVIAIRQSKLPDPKHIPNAGSFFKNPIVPMAQFNRLKKQFADLPSFYFDDEQVKIPAAWLIDQCGWKGRQVGNVGVHDQQALVLVNHGQCRGEELLSLSKSIQQDVESTFNIALTPEVGIV